MKSSETEILVIPGYEGSGPIHWQSRMVAKLSTARFVQQPDWLYSSLSDAVGQVVAAVDAASKPVVFVTHSVGGVVLVHAVSSLRQLGLIDRVRGAFLVVPPASRTLATLQNIDPAIADLPRDPLPFPTVLVASNNDEFSTMLEATDLAQALGAKLIEAGDAGHINTASGHGPWPEGMMSFAGWLSRLEN
jgi:uncharacterized protein